MNSFLQDLRYAARSLSKTPGFTVLAALTLALGIGANTAIFSVVHGVLLKPLPYERPDEIVRVLPQRRLSKEMLVAFEQTESFSAVAGYHAAKFSLIGTGDPEEVTGLAVAPGHFAVLGVQPALGRAFRVEDRRPGAEPVAILSHGLWQRRFAADSDILGRAVFLDGLGQSSRTVVGVLSAEFRPMLGETTQAWVPITFDAGNLDDYRDMIALRALARLAPGVTLAQAEAEVKTIAKRLQQALPGYHSDQQVRAAGVTRLHEMLTGETGSTLWMLLGAVGCVLLIGCSNIANLLLTRAGGRQQELAVRAALGADRPRLMRQLLTESVLLGALGGATGLFAAAWLEPLMVASLPAAVPRVTEVGIELGEVGFAVGLSWLAALVSGLIPALRATRGELRGSLRAGDRRSSAGPKRHRLNQSLVAAEIALSVVLVTAAGLMLTSLSRLQQVEPGFTSDRLLALRLSPPAAEYDAAGELSAYYREVIDRLEALPGVESASAINYLPMTTPNMRLGFSTLDHPVTPDTPPPVVSARAVAPGYFRTMGIPVMQGRGAGATDLTGSAQVGWINQTLAQQLWPSVDPIGRQILWEDGSPWFTVAGVVGDVRQHRLDQETQAEVYRPFDQAYEELRSQAMFLAVRTHGDATALAPAVRRAVWAIDSDVPISGLRSMDQVIDSSLSGSRFFTVQLAAFGILALLLGATGVYGVGSYAVSQRTREIGVRMALGARRRTVLRSVMADELAPVIVGVGIGLVAALGATRLLESSLFGVSASDPLTFALVALILATVAAAASYLPARRASAVDPIVALRSE